MKIVNLPTGKAHLLRREVVVHSTGTKPDAVLKEPGGLPYHFLVTRGGRLSALHKVRKNDRVIDIAFAGGLDKHGHITDNRTAAQSETLFNTLVMLSDRYRIVLIKGSDEVQKSGFDVQQWAKEYVPPFLEAA